MFGHQFLPGAAPPFGVLHCTWLSQSELDCLAMAKLKEITGCRWEAGECQHAFLASSAAPSECDVLEYRINCPIVRETAPSPPAARARAFQRLRVLRVEWDDRAFPRAFRREPEVHHKCVGHIAGIIETAPALKEIHVEGLCSGDLQRIVDAIGRRTLDDPVELHFTGLYEDLMLCVFGGQHFDLAGRAVLCPKHAFARRRFVLAAVHVVLCPCIGQVLHDVVSVFESNPEVTAASNGTLRCLSFDPADPAEAELDGLHTWEARLLALFPGLSWIRIGRRIAQGRAPPAVAVST